METNNEKAFQKLLSAFNDKFSDVNQDKRSEYSEFARDNIPNFSSMNMEVLAGSFYYFYKNYDYTSKNIRTIADKISGLDISNRNKYMQALIRYITYINDLYNKG